jgi:hypothetical protein
MDTPKDKVHSPEEISDYIARNYPEFANASSMSIGALGGIYRIGIIDSQHVNHTINIDPKHIDADREKQLKGKAPAAAAKARDDDKLDSARKTAATFKAKQERGHDRDQDRER